MPWALDADPALDEKAGEQCLALLPKRWSPPTHKQVYSWRLDPRELGAAQAPEGDERRKRMRRLRMILTRQSEHVCICILSGSGSLDASIQ